MAANFSELTNAADTVVARGLTFDFWARVVGSDGIRTLVALSTPQISGMANNGGLWFSPLPSSFPWFGDLLAEAVPRNLSWLDSAWHHHAQVLEPGPVRYLHYVDGALSYTADTLPGQYATLRDWAFSLDGVPRTFALAVGGLASAFPVLGPTFPVDVAVDSLRVYSAALTPSEIAASAAVSAAVDLPAALRAKAIAAWNFDSAGYTAFAPLGNVPAALGTTSLAAVDFAAADLVSPGGTPTIPDGKCSPVPIAVVSGAGGACAVATSVLRLAAGAAAFSSLPIPRLAAGAVTSGGLVLAGASSADVLARASVASGGAAVAVSGAGAVAGDYVVVVARGGAPGGANATVRLVVAAAGTAPVVSDVVWSLDAAVGGATAARAVAFSVADAEGDAITVTAAVAGGAAMPDGLLLRAARPCPEQEVYHAVPPQPLRAGAVLELAGGVFGVPAALLRYSAVDDSGAASGEAGVRVDVSGANAATQAVGLVVGTREDGGGVEFSLAAAVVDPDSAFVTVVIRGVSPAAAGTLWRTPIPTATPLGTSVAANASAAAAAVIAAAAGAAWQEVTSFGDGGQVEEQWLAECPAASSESEPWTGPPAPIPSFARVRVEGTPDCSDADDSTCWYPVDPDNCAPQVAEPRGQGGEWLVVRTAVAYAPTMVSVVEYGVLSALVGIHARGAGGEWVRMYRRDKSREKSGVDNEHAATTPPQCGVPVLTREFLLEFDECSCRGWSGVDAAQVFGIADPPLAAAPAVGTRWRFVPRGNFNGNVTVSFVASDCWLDPVRATAPTSLTIVVAPVPDPPTAVLPSGDAAVVADGAQAVRVEVAAFDVDIVGATAASAVPATAAAGYDIVIVTPPARAPAVVEDGRVAYGPPLDALAAACGREYSDWFSVAVVSRSDGLRSPPVNVTVAGCLGAIILAPPSGSTVLAVAVAVPLGCVVMAAVVVAVAFAAWGLLANSKRLPETRPPPTGVVALAFTDVQDSTALWEIFRDSFIEALSVHDAVLRSEIVACAGYEVKTEGDAFFVAFDCAHDAVAWCIRSQLALLAAPWPDDLLAELTSRGLHPSDVWRGLRVRMGVHVGEPLCERSPTTTRMDYHGPLVKVGARVQGAGAGGQILVSAAVRAALEAPTCRGGPRCEPGLGWGAEVLFAAQGAPPLKGVSETVELFGVIVPALASRVFPPLGMGTGVAASAADKLAVDGPRAPRAAAARHRRTVPGMPQQAVSAAIVPQSPRVGESVVSYSGGVLRRPAGPRLVVVGAGYLASDGSAVSSLTAAVLRRFANAFDAAAAAAPDTDPATYLARFCSPADDRDSGWRRDPWGGAMPPGTVRVVEDFARRLLARRDSAMPPTAAAILAEFLLAAPPEIRTYAHVREGTADLSSSTLGEAAR